MAERRVLRTRRVAQRRGAQRRRPFRPTRQDERNREIYARAAAGEAMADLAQEFGLSYSRVVAIKNWEHRKQIPGGVERRSGLDRRR